MIFEIHLSSKQLKIGEYEMIFELIVFVEREHINRGIVCILRLSTWKVMILDRTWIWTVCIVEDFEHIGRFRIWWEKW